MAFWILISLALGACSAGEDSASPQSGTSTVPRCGQVLDVPPSEVGLEVDEIRVADRGFRAIVTMRNTSEHSIQVRQIPIMVAVDDEGRVISTSGILAIATGDTTIDPGSSVDVELTGGISPGGMVAIHRCGSGSGSSAQLIEPGDYTFVVPVTVVGGRENFRAGAIDLTVTTEGVEVVN